MLADCGVRDLGFGVALGHPGGESEPAAGDEHAAGFGERRLRLRQMQDSEVDRYGVERCVRKRQLGAILAVALLPAQPLRPSSEVRVDE